MFRVARIELVSSVIDQLAVCGQAELLAAPWRKVSKPSTLEPACKVHGCKVFSNVRCIFGWSQSKSAVLSYNPDVRSARLYGQFSLDKTLTLQAGGTVIRFVQRCMI